MLFKLVRTNIKNKRFRIMDKKGDEKEKESFDRTVKLIDKPLEFFNKLSPLEQAGTFIAVGLTSVIAVPRIMPIRALYIGFRSLIRGPQTKSLRSKAFIMLYKKLKTNSSLLEVQSALERLLQLRMRWHTLGRSAMLRIQSLQA